MLPLVKLADPDPPGIIFSAKFHFWSSYTSLNVEDEILMPRTLEVNAK